ncbi:MAG: hypothetical protein KGI33_12730 [Thaumarchaeota archaeon]|nr:hypothetical protein [Nitrososphaerota archaeon]
MYNILTIRNETYGRIIAVIHVAKKKGRRMYTDGFLEMLLDLYENKSRQIK